MVTNEIGGFMIRTSQIPVLHRYYKITRFYQFLKSMAGKAFWIIFIFSAVILGLEYFFIDINSLLNKLVTNFSEFTVFMIFMISETLFGLLPPEIFIAWASKSESSWFSLFVLATISYVGGIGSYLIGLLISRIAVVKNYLENKVKTHITNLRKWGGFFIIVGATLPIPHSVVSMASGLIHFSFANYLLWALFRYLRFGLYALVIFQIL